MRLQSPPSIWPLVAAVVLSLGFASSAQAIPMQITVDATVLVDDYGAIGVGVPISVDFFVDSFTADEDVTANIFSATNPGTLGTTILVPLTGMITDINADAGTGNWTLAGFADLNPMFPALLPIAMNTLGTGLTPDQVLPDFILLPGGLMSIDITAIASLLSGGPDLGSEIIVTGVDNITISAVPEPKTALLVTLGLAGLGFAGRKRTDRG